MNSILPQMLVIVGFWVPTSVRAEVHRELARVAAGVRADLAFERPLVVVDTQVLLQTAAVGCCVGTVLTFVRLLACVRAAVHVELVASAEALVAQFTFKRLLTCRKRKEKTLTGLRQQCATCTASTYRCGSSGVAPCPFDHTVS